MLAIFGRKSNLIGPIVLGLLLAIYIGSVHSMLRSADTKVLVPVALGPEPIQRFVAGREHCADAGMPLTFGPNYSGPAMNALELAYLMEREFPHLDYSSVIEVLEHSDRSLHCTTQ